MATVIAQRGLAALSLAIGHARGGGTTAARNVVVPRVHHARCFTRRSGVAMRGWRMGEGGGAEGNDESEAESTSPWDTGGARAGGRGNRGGNARDSEPRAPSRRYADDEPGDYGSFDDDDGFDSRSSRGGGYDRRPRGGGGRGGRGRGGGRGMRGRGATRGRGRRDSAYADEDDSSSSTGYDDDDVDGDGRTRWQSRHDEKKANRRENGVLTLAERLVGEAVYGRNPVLAMLGADRRDVSGIWIQEGSDASRDKALLKAAAARGITPEYASKHDLNMLTGGGSRPHNGVVADASPLTPTPMDSLPLPDGYTPGVGPPPVWLALDEVVDPQNLGAVLRSAHFLGVSGVVVCAKNSVSVFLCVFVWAISRLTSCFFNRLLCRRWRPRLRPARWSAWTSGPWA